MISLKIEMNVFLLCKLIEQYGFNKYSFMYIFLGKN